MPLGANLISLRCNLTQLRQISARFCTNCVHGPVAYAEGIRHHSPFMKILVTSPARGGFRVCGYQSGITAMSTSLL